MLLLATEVDFVTLGSLLFAAVSAIVGVLATSWIGVKKICIYFWNYFEPKLEEFLGEQTGLVREMKQNVPVVRDTMKTIAASQERLINSQISQNETLKFLSEASDRHEELHAQTGKKLDQIIDHLSHKDIPTQQ